MKTVYYTPSNSELCHYGIKGQKWGRRKARVKVSDVRRKKAAENKKTKPDKHAKRQGRAKRLVSVGTGVVTALLTGRAGYRLATGAITNDSRFLVAGALDGAGALAVHTTGKMITRALDDD